MRKFRKTLATAMALFMITGMASFYAFADDNGTIHVDVRIEGVTEMVFKTRGVELPEGATALDLVRLLNETDGAPEIKFTENAYGAYINSIGDLKEMDYGGYSGWNYRINGEDPGVGIDAQKLVDMDNVLFFYADPFNMAVQNPVINWDYLVSGGIIGFTSYDTEWDENWNPTSRYNPIIGAAVTFNGDEYTTDGNGEVLLASKAGVAGINTMQIERYDDETGLPTVLRFDPDFSVYIPFADTPAGIWYENALIFCIIEWDFKGTDLVNNLFSPLLTMPMEQLVTVLARVAGADIESRESPWYGAELDWAVENGIITEDEFAEGAGVRKDKLLYLFYLTINLTGERDMDVRADITGATDYAEIDEKYLDAVSWAVASGVVQGTSDEELTVDPAAEFNRAMVCQLLYNYLG